MTIAAIDFPFAKLICIITKNTKLGTLTIMWELKTLNRKASY